VGGEGGIAISTRVCEIWLKKCHWLAYRNFGKTA